ncbi:MAG: EAL domain-containing protein, partial [Pseudomonadota bacterium]
LRDLDQAISVAKALRELGAALILDDFGTGHSSFLWLARLPADSLKVDFDLISQISDQRVRTILETITLLAKRLDMTITAEGVEQRDLLHVLQDIGFDYAQGFALGRPMTVPAATALLTEAA